MTGIVAGLILLCILVVVHELGHFLFAKALGVRVLTFSVGFGPKLFSFKRKETEYRFSAILLGGYVKMYGESFTDEVSDAEKKYSFMHQAIWKKSLIAFGGPLFNFILPVLLFFFMFIGSETTLSPVVGTVLPNQAAAAAGLKAGDRILALDGNKVETFAELVEQVSNKPGIPVLLEIERKEASNTITKLQLRVVPEAEVNTHPLYQGEFIGRIGVMPAVQKPQIAVVHPASVAAKAGLLSFDEVLTVDKVPVLSAADLLEKISNFPGENLALVVKRTLSDGSESVLPILLPSRSQKPWSYKVDKAMKRFAVTEDELVDATFKKQIESSSSLIAEVEKLDWQHRGIAFIDGTLAGVEDDSA
ncbi:MAG: RIP metalloprotease RseP, partial [Bacteroidetes bacterium]|nr:RIP metalloprotease RseP [Bacteroidota bacterium]